MLILNHLLKSKSFRYNTYKKHRGGGLLWLARYPDKPCLTRLTDSSVPTDSSRMQTASHPATTKGRSSFPARRIVLPAPRSSCPSASSCAASHLCSRDGLSRSRRTSGTPSFHRPAKGVETSRSLRQT